MVRVFFWCFRIRKLLRLLLERAYMNCGFFYLCFFLRRFEGNLGLFGGFYVLDISLKDLVLIEYLYSSREDCKVNKIWFLWLWFCG